MRVITTNHKRFDNPATRKIRKQLRKCILLKKSIPSELVEKLRKSDPKAYHYYTHMREVLS